MYFTLATVVCPEDAAVKEDKQVPHSDILDP